LYDTDFYKRLFIFDSIKHNWYNVKHEISEVDLVILKRYIHRKVSKYQTKKILHIFIALFTFCSLTVTSQIKNKTPDLDFKAKKNRVTSKDSISIKLKDSLHNVELFGIQVQIKDSIGTIVKQGLTNKNGRITFLNLPSDTVFFLNYSGLGYKNLNEIKIKPEKRIQIIELVASLYQLNEILITAKKERFFVKGDTISYNANLYKSATDENVGNIIKKLPGVLLKDGNLMVEGDKVNNILLDGKTYIKSKVSVTLEQIPSEIIYRIEIIDNVSPEDPALQLKTINIITKSKKVLTFGKLVSNYGTSDRYRNAGNYYIKTKNHRLTAMADANNINKEDLMADDLSDLFEGTNSLLAGGLNYQYQSDNNSELEFNLISNKVNRKEYDFFNQYLLASPEDGPRLNTTNTKQIKDYIHSYNFLFSQELPSNFSLLLESNGSYLSSLIHNNFTDQRFNGSTNVYELNSTSSSKQNNLLFDNSLTLIKNFERRANKLVTNREVSLLLNYKIKEEKYKDSLTYNYTDTPSSNLRQIRNTTIPVKNKLIMLDFTENWGENYLINYNFSTDLASINNKILTSQYDNDQFLSGKLDSTLSSINEIKQQNYSVSFKLVRNTKLTQTTFGINYNKLTIDGDFVFPSTEIFSTNFPVILPIVSFVYKNEKSSRFKITYKALQEAPQFRQLNPIIDNTIPSRLFLGDSKLIPEIKHVFDVEIKFKGPKDFQHLFRFNTTKVENHIGESVYFPVNDSIINGFEVKGGTQLILPINFNRQKSSTFSVNHERNIDKFKYGIHYGYRQDLLPTRQNSILSDTKINRYSSGIYWNYYPTYVLSFNINYYGSYAEIQNSVSTGSNQSVLNWNAGISIRYLLFESLLLDFESNSFQVKAISLPSSNKKITSILNFNAKQTLFKKHKISTLFQIHDLLNQNRDITQNPTALYITQEQKTMLGRYFIFGISVSF
jgi:hypothetical protein